MAKPTRHTPVPNAPRTVPKTAPNESGNSYWASLNQTLETDEYEVMLPKAVHGLRRAAIHRKI